MKGAAIKNSNIHISSKIEAGSQIVNVKLDKYSFCGYNCKILNCDIGAFCSIADNVVIGGAQHPIEWVSSSPVFYAGRDSIKRKFSTFKRGEIKRTVIGNDVWIGDNVLIKSGIVIGNGAIIGMGSVVTKNVEPYEIVGGVPAKRIRFRFSKNIRERIEKSKWWELDDERLKKVSMFIREPLKFLEELEK